MRDLPEVTQLGGGEAGTQTRMHSDPELAMPAVLPPPRLQRRPLRPRGQRGGFVHGIFSASAHTRLKLGVRALAGDRKDSFPGGGASSFLCPLPPPGQGPGLTGLQEFSFGLQLLPLCQRRFPGQVVAGKLLQKASVGPAWLG